MDASIFDRVEAFSKVNKVSLEKLLVFVSNILNSESQVPAPKQGTIPQVKEEPKQEAKPVKEVKEHKVRNFTGRAALESTLVNREKFIKDLPDFFGEFTASDIAARYGIKPVEANNLLSYFTKQGKIQIAGKIVKYGKPGKPSNIYKVI